MFLKALKTYLRQPSKKVPQGESFSDFTSRWGGALARLMASDTPTAIVTSHTNLLSLPHILQGKPALNLTDGRPNPGEVLVIRPKSKSATLIAKGTPARSPSGDKEGYENRPVLRGRSEAAIS